MYCQTLFKSWDQTERGSFWPKSGRNLTGYNNLENIPSCKCYLIMWLPICKVLPKVQGGHSNNPWHMCKLNTAGLDGQLWDRDWEKSKLCKIWNECWLDVVFCRMSPCGLCHWGRKRTRPLCLPPSLRPADIPEVNIFNYHRLFILRWFLRCVSFCLAYVVCEYKFNSNTRSR